MLVATLAAALSLAACSAGGGAQTSSGASAGGGEGGSVGANRSESANGTASGKSTSGIGDAARLVPALGAQIRTAATTIRVDDVPAAVRAARTSRYGGQASSPLCEPTSHPTRRTTPAPS
ncbi:MAG: hypothetical protein M3Q27_17080 [Actinomycetota bacterium]|nr:hypothetical protein [Actinomycetota bacterium]